MKALDFGFWEFLAVESVFFSDGEMDSDFALVEVNVREGSRGRWSGIESESELAYEDFVILIVANHIVESLEFGREMVGWENSPVFYYHLEWLADADSEIVSGIGIDEAFSIYITKVERFCKHFSDRECSSFMFCLGIIAGIPEDSVDLSENKLGTVGGDKFCFASFGKKFRENLE